MLKDLETYLKNTKEINLKKLEERIVSKVLDPQKNPKAYEIVIRKNPAFSSKSRINIEREFRPMETGGEITPLMSKEHCVFCNPGIGFAGFSKETGLKDIYRLNETVAFSNLFPSGKVHGIVIHNKNHVVDARKLNSLNWIDSIKLVQKIGLESKREYISYNVNHGQKAAASIEHFHGQFHCEDEPLSKTLYCMGLTKKLGGSSKKWWKSWVKSMNSKGLVIDFDSQSKTVMFVEWSPSFGKTEIVVLNLECPAFQSMNEKETAAVARFLEKATKITTENISTQFNIVNLSAAPKGDFCNQFRIFSRAPLTQGTKSWEGYLEFANETVPHISPEKFAEIARKY
jgi:diadenosine tetraphosphate (Ap4A) HIT family hydrolase